MNIKDHLDTVNLTKQIRQEFLPFMSNWVVMSKFLKHVDQKNTMLTMIKLELLTNNRPEIVFRLHSKYNSLRRKDEREELMGMLYEGEKG